MFLYRITNAANNKQYIGQSVDIERRWKEHKRKLERGSHHNSHLQGAWSMYGSSSFVFELITECATPEELNKLEQEHIAYSGSLSPNGYNLAYGGDNYKKTEEHKQNIGNAHRGMKRSDEAKKRMSEWQTGRTLSESHRKRLSEVRTGKKLPSRSDEQKEQLREARKKQVMKPHSDETKQKMSDARRQYWERRRMEKTQ